MERTHIEIDLEVNRAIEAERNSFSETKNDILRRLLGVGDEKHQSMPVRKRMRNTGTFSYAVRGRIQEEYSLKSAYLDCLRLIIDGDEKKADKIESIPLRSRKIISRKPELLYKKSPHLASLHAERLIEGWWIDLNVSEQQVLSRLKLICQAIDLPFGKSEGVVFTPPRN